MSRIIKRVKPFLMKDGEPTAITKQLQKTEEGRRVIMAMFTYYVSTCRPKAIPASSLDLSINIEDYRLGKG